MKTYNITKTKAGNRAEVIESFNTIEEARQELADILNAEVNRVAQNSWSRKEAMKQLLKGGEIEDEVISWEAHYVESDTTKWRIEEVEE